MKRLALLLLLASPAFAQTPVAIQNANFQAPVTFTASDAAGDEWVPNTVPGWTIGPGPGVPGTFAGIQQLTTACGSPTQMLYSNDPTVTQDVGPQQAGTYTLTVGVCNRADSIGSNAIYTIGLNSCTQAALNSTIPAGTVSTVALTCPVVNPVGDVLVSLGCSGPQCDFASVAVTFAPAGPPPPFVWVMPGLGTATFSMYVPPACGPNDGTCSIQIQVCDTSQTPPVCMTAPVGTLSLVKSITLPTPQVQTIPIVTVTNP
jgi:hypothetical protein